MTQRVFTNSMCAHVWAQQTQDSGRTNNGNMYFEGDTIYSYGTHYPIAKFIQTTDGRKAVLFNKNHSSPTTEGKHKNAVRRAVNYGQDFPLFYVNSPINNHYFNFSDARKDFENFLKTIPAKSTNRKYARMAGEAETMVRDANAYAEAFALDPEHRLTMPANIQAHLAEARSADEKRRLDALERARDNIVSALNEWSADLADWRAGTPLRGSVRYRESQVPCDLWPEVQAAMAPKLRVQGDTVETTWGAVVPVEHARDLWRRIVTTMESGEARDFTDMVKPVVGDFRVDRIEADGSLHAGCHHIPYPELARVARDLGLSMPE